MSMFKDVKSWAWSLIAGFIRGAADAGSSWLALAGAHTMGIDVPTLNWKGLGVVCLISGVSHTLRYLKDAPLPPEGEDTAFIAKPKDTP